MASIRLENITKRFGETVALNDVSLDINDGEFFAVLGPPGAGKTTMLRTIVGLEKPDEGDIYLDDDKVTDVWPGDRDIALVFQNLALYPDKTVFKNLAFPLKRQKVPKDEIKRRVNDVASLLHIEHLLKRKPGKLSGGERQRVALGRALVREPKAFLLDEPISALDALLRIEMRTELTHLQQDLGRTMVYVTHDQVEALSMADRIAVLREGVIQQVDHPETVYHRPANRFVATTVGSPPMNFIPARVSWSNGSFSAAHPQFDVGVAPGAVSENLRSALAEGEQCLVGIRPEDVHMDLSRERGVPATIYVTEPLGAEMVVDFRLGQLVFKALTPPTAQLAENQDVGAWLDPARLHIFSEEGESLLSAAGESEIFEVRPRRS